MVYDVNNNTQEFGSVIGVGQMSNAAFNCYYLKGTCYSQSNGVLKLESDRGLTLTQNSGFSNEGTTMQEASYLKSTTFLNQLNANASGIWKQDTNNINSGYPILSWQ